MTATINASTSSGLITTADTSGTLALQSNGTTQLTVSSTGSYGQLKSGTAQASTSGSSIDFTSIPSWVKRITVMFSGVSTNGTSIIQTQLGAGSVTTSGYIGTSDTLGGSTGSPTAYTTGLGLGRVSSASYVRTGHIVFTNVSGNTWVGVYLATSSGVLTTESGSTAITLSGTLDRIRITTVNGTDTFDAGSINILYEG